MARTRTVRCPVCASTWPLAHARFCGRCGARVAAPQPRQRHRVPRWLAVAATAFAVVAATTGAVASIGMLDLPSGADEAVVAVNREGTPPSGQPLDDETRARLLEPFDQNTVRCAPRDCELWRFELPQGASVVAYNQLGNLFVVMHDQRMLGIDLATGEERWDASWPEGTSNSHEAWTMVLADEDRDLVVAVRPEQGEIMVIDGDGRLLWHHDTEDVSSHVVLVDGVLLLGPYADPYEVDRPPVQAFDAGTGELLWAGDVGGLVFTDTDLALVRDGGEVHRIDPGTGDILASAPMQEGSWAHVSNGLVQANEYEQRRHVLYDPQTLELLAAIEGVDEVVPLPEDGLLVAATYAGSRFGADVAGPETLHVYDLAGSRRWSFESAEGDETPSLCCPIPHVADGLLIVASAGGTETFGFDLDTGELQLVERRDDDSAVSRGHGGLVYEQRSDGLIISTPHGAVRVTGSGVWPVAEGPPLVVTNGRTLLAVDPDLGRDAP